METSTFDQAKRKMIYIRFFFFFLLRITIRPELFLGKILEAPRKVKFEEQRDTASDLGEDRGDFYFVKAEHIPLRFSVQRAGSSSSTPNTLDAKPAHSPTVNPGGHGHGFWRSKPFNRGHSSKPDRDYV